MGNNTITAVVVGALIVVVAFSLWPILNGATNSLYAYFRDSCDDGSGGRFLAVYEGINTGKPTTTQYNIADKIHGGAGLSVGKATTGTACAGTGAFRTVNSNANDGVAGLTEAELGEALERTYNFYDEHGNSVGSGDFGVTVLAAASVSTSAVAGEMTDDIEYKSADTFEYVKVAGVLNFFSGINNILLAIIPVVSIGGFLGISGAKLYSYGRSAGGNIASHLSGSVFTLVALIITIIIAPVIMDSLIGANQVVVSGQYQINNQFGTILELLFGAIPLLYIAGLVGLIGMQARSALMGNKGGGGKSGMT